MIYSVWLIENHETNEQFTVDFTAINEQDAVEQTIEAYPKADIIWVEKR